MDRQTLGEMDLPAHIWEPFAQSRAAIRCSPGFLIYLQGTEATCFYYLKEGRVKSFIQSETGDERVLNIYRAGSLFGCPGCPPPWLSPPASWCPSTGSWSPRPSPETRSWPWP